MNISKTSFNKIGKMMLDGKKYIYKERAEQWDYLCYTSLKSQKLRFILEEYIYRIIETLTTSKTSMEKLVEELDDDILPDDEWNLMLLQVVKFAPRGYEFAKESKREKSSQMLHELEILNGENQLYTINNPKRSIKR